MRIKFDVLDAIKKLNPQSVLIVSNQCGIENTYSFKCKSVYIIQVIRDYCDCECYAMYCEPNDKSEYRKPNTGMLEKLMENCVGDDFDFIKQKSLMIGDESGKEGQFSDIDKKTAENFGIDYIDVNDFVNTIMNKHLNFMNSYNYYPKTIEELRKIIEQRIAEEGNEVDLNDIYVSEITDMSHLFSYSNFNGDISKWNVSNVTDMSSMFEGCTVFNQDISKWDVSRVTDMSFMFDSCKEFNKDISNWDVSNVTDMSYMFYDCENFNGNISKWDVSNVANMDNMFYGCKKFNRDISNWNVLKVTNTVYMFDRCLIKDKYKPIFIYK